MDDRRTYEILSKAYQNPTKVSIIVLLAENPRMTVTQMAKYIDVSRSNLYHFVSQMVEDGILNPPEVVPKKNYVEKYYSVNDDLINSVEVEDWVKHIKSMDRTEFRDLVSSLLLSYSLQTKIFAERVANSGLEEVERIRKWMVEFPISLVYSTMSFPKARKLHVKLESVMETLVEDGSETDKESMKGGGFLLLMFLPFILDEGR